MTHRLMKFVALVTIVVLMAGCAAGRAFGRGERAAQMGDWDAAVEHYRQAVQEQPGNPEYRIALERAMLSASAAHLDQARVFEARGQLQEALREYRRASEFDPPNRQLAAKVTEMERRIRDSMEAGRAPAAAPQAGAPPSPGAPLQPGAPPAAPRLDTVVSPLKFGPANLRDILTTLGQTAGIDVTFERDFQERTYSIQLDKTTVGEALEQIMTATGNFYKVVNQRTILVIPDNPQKRQQYEDQVVQTIHLSHSDANEVAQTLTQLLRIPGAQGVPPTIVPNKTSNSIIARATSSVMPIIEQIVRMQDTPRAEVLIDLQIMEVSKSRTREYGLNLSDYAVQGVFSPEVDPRTTDGLVSPPFNLNTVTRGVSASDFYLAVPSAVVRFLETDQRTKVMAKPQLRGAEGATIKFNIGEEIPVLSTAFTPIAGGGSNVNPLTSYNYRPVGIIVEMIPRVTYQDEIVLDLILENSALGVPISVAGQSIPSFTSRKVTTRLRLREGESTLLAGLLQDDERTSANGFPGLLQIPVLRQLLGANRNTVSQTDVVMLLTPRIVRTHELTPQDIAPLFIGTQNNLTLGGPPPLLAGAQPAAPAPATAGPVAVPSPATPPAVAAAPAPVAGGAPGAPVISPGISPVPGAANVPAAALPGQRTATGEVVISPPSAEFRVGSGPYNVPISIVNASQISSVSVTVTYNPAVLRLRATAEGSFMRLGGVNATFTQSPDAAAGRVDIAIVRAGDATGVAGTGLLAALLFEPIAAGPANLTVTATASAPGGAPVPLQFAPITPVTVK